MTAAEIFSLPLLIAAAVLGLTAWLLTKGSKRLPPGPLGLPLIGYHPFLSEEPYKDFIKLGAKYGPVSSYRSLGGRLVVIFNGTKAIKEMFVNRADEILGRPGANMVDWISDGVGMTQEEGDAWKEQRRFFLSTAKNYGFGKLELEDRMHDEYRQMLIDLRDTKGQDTDLQFHISYANNCIISHLLFSKRFEKEDFYKDLTAAFQKVVRLFVGKKMVLVGFMLKLTLMFAPEMKAATKAKQMFKKLTADIVKEHIKNLEPTNPKDYVDEYLVHMNKLIKSGNKGTFTIERLEANALNLFLEGTESVSYTIANHLDKLSLHEDAQLKVQAELDSVIGKERLPSWGDRPLLPRLDATIQELLRTRPPFFVSTMYSNFEETTIRGYCIPKRSALIYNIGSMHLDPEIYPDPEKFNPERFLDASGRKLKCEGPFPFGIGFALKCYVCNSEYDDSCEEIDTNQHLTDCTTINEDANRNHTLCRKESFSAYSKHFKMSTSRTVRSCGYTKHPEYDCFYSSRRDNKKATCECKEDGCNTSSNLYFSLQNLVLSFKFVSVLLKNQMISVCLIKCFQYSTFTIFCCRI